MVVARQRGVESWAALKTALKKEPPVPDDFWYQTNLDVFLNRWFSTYDQARASLQAEGGYLLPYRRHFYICAAGVIRALGLDPDDPDWQRIGWDCAKPADREAHRRLVEKRMRVLEESSSSKAQ